MMPQSKDVYGQGLEFARKQLKLVGTRHFYVLRMVRGIWVVKWLVKERGQLLPSYAALGRKGQVVSGIGSRQETITAAGGRLD